MVLVLCTLCTSKRKAWLFIQKLAKLIEYPWMVTFTFKVLKVYESAKNILKSSGWTFLLD